MIHLYDNYYITAAKKLLSVPPSFFNSFLDLNWKSCCYARFLFALLHALSIKYFELFKVPTVTWSMSLQKEAEDWANYLAENNLFQHSKKNPGNLYMDVVKRPEICSDAIWWFHNEEKYYNYSNPRYVFKAGHFTAVSHEHRNHVYEKTKTTTKNKHTRK